LEFKINPGVSVALGFYDFSNEPVSDGVTDIFCSVIGSFTTRMCKNDFSIVTKYATVWACNNSRIGEWIFIIFGIEVFLIFVEISGVD
jgi:hypothetical protein